ncbi:hypothetical protein [Alloalcanivorax xenomutans]|jgi:Flp pilus assembly pilin Flp|uniref:hypothetical protein n=1 Tax=Alloalcanivorax xenomutans TaxID=1094342 RepID=UPI0017C540FB|nr:hypothetical protein [Alloalcanivorax xenomutans]MBA4719501.1 hypothetical protein [Alcanivorax sp.]MCE7523027.1 hypothetical protein [Alloalcanivorax xenomutans]
MKMIQSFNTAIQSLMVRLFTQMPTRSNRQRGASALEYIVLAAGLIIVIAAAAAFLNKNNSLGQAFTDLFGKAQQEVNDSQPE